MNPEQRQAVEAPAGPLRILAGAGTGKTYTLVRRIARLVEGGTAPQRVLAVTFSADARKEIGGRLQREGLGEVDVSTWHSLAWRILREDETRWASWELDKGPAFKRIVSEALGPKGVGWEEADESGFRRLLGLAAANLWTPDSPEAVAFAVRFFAANGRRALDAWRLVETLCERDKVLTFDALLVHAVSHLRDEGARLWWGARWDHVLQDEYQDVSPVQNALAVALAEGHRSYVVVGDPDQSIYAFRGSSPAHIVAFPEEWEGAATITLTRNYRSARAIIAASNAVIAPTSTRSPLLAERDLDGTVDVVEAEDVDDEARLLAEHIQREHEAGASWKDFAVLWRTNAQSRAVEEALLRAGVPHVILGADPFFARREVRSLLAYLRLAAGSQAQEDVVDSINTPNRFLGRAFVGSVVLHRDCETTWTDAVRVAAAQDGIWRKQRDAAIQWAELIQNLSRGVAMAQLPASLLTHVARVTGFADWLKKRGGGEDDDAGSVVDEAIAAAARHQTVESFLKFVDSAIAGGRRAEPGQAGGDRVTCCSIHKSKGLEWPRVWVVGANEGKLPHARAQEDEERRLIYVAMTRARDELTVSWWASTGGEQRDGRPSRFLFDAGILKVAERRNAA